MKQAVTANKLLEELNRNGFIALYINFDTGKSDLKADGKATVGEIATMLKSAPSLRIAIEGHTDNVGQPVADNRGEDGRAKNRRVELVKR